MSPVFTQNPEARVLHLEFANSLTLDEMRHINQRVMDALERADRKLILLLDTSNLMVGYSTVDHLRSTQQYGDHDNLDMIVAIADKPLNRLISLLVFSLSKARLIQFDSKEKAQQYIDQKTKL